MVNSFYNASGTPGTQSPGASAPQRGEFLAIQAGFDKMPTLAGHANEIAVINGSGTAMASIPGLSFTMNAFTVGLVANANVTLQLPATNGTLALTSDVTTAVAAAAPPGSVHLFAGSALPAGFLHCAGQAVTRSAPNVALFAAIGVTWGAGDGSTTFNLPDLRGRVPAGVDNPGGLGTAGRLTAASMAPNGISLAAVGGTQTNTATTASSGNNTINSSGSNTIVVSGGAGQGFGGFLGGTLTFSSAGGSTANQDAAWGVSANGGNTINVTSGSITINVSGTSGAFNVVQPTVLLFYIIKQ